MEDITNMNKNYFFHKEIIFFKLITSNPSVTTEQRIQRKFLTLVVIITCFKTPKLPNKLPNKPTDSPAFCLVVAHV